MLWFAFKLVSLNHWEQFETLRYVNAYVVICFQISIFEPLGTILYIHRVDSSGLWFAFKLVSLNHWEQFQLNPSLEPGVVICFQISIFEPLGTIPPRMVGSHLLLWFAFKLVSLNHWEQSLISEEITNSVVICFQISIFEPLGTIESRFANSEGSCDLLSN